MTETPAAELQESLVLIRDRVAREIELLDEGFIFQQKIKFTFYTFLAILLATIDGLLLFRMATFSQVLTALISLMITAVCVLLFKRGFLFRTPPYLTRRDEMRRLLMDLIVNAHPSKVVDLQYLRDVEQQLLTLLRKSDSHCSTASG